MNSEHDFRAPVAEPRTEPLPLPPVRNNLILFVVTVISMLYAGALFAQGANGIEDSRTAWEQLLDPKFLASGAAFALPLLAILITHEFGHFFAARYHRVPASFPFFIPFPATFGTMGAVIVMRDTIRSRKALLDIGASGPLAGMVVALPVLVYGLTLSPVQRVTEHATQEGQSLLYLLIKRVVLGPIPDGYDVFLHPIAFAGWAGLFVTMLNLLPVSQLDGGHIGYALLGEAHHRVAAWFRHALRFLFLASAVYFVVPVLLGKSNLTLEVAISNSMFWFIWLIVLTVMAVLSGSPNHPPCEPGDLNPSRKAVAWGCLALFVLLFMPMPFTRT